MSSIFNALFRSVSISAPPNPPPTDTPTIQPTPDRAGISAQHLPPAQLAAQSVHPRTVSDPITRSINDPPYPPSPYSAGHGNLSGDRSYDNSTSTNSELTDILFPRGVPYIHRRQLNNAQTEQEGAPMKTLSFYPPGSVRGRPITIRHPTDPAPPKAKPMQLTEWRKEQIRRQNQARLIEPIVLKAIPALHGPPNLPYARNPSGVDASIPDDSTAYLAYQNASAHAAQGHHKASQVPPDSRPSPMPHHDHQALPAPLHPQTIRMTTRVPYQQHVETADLIQGDGGYHKTAPTTWAQLVAEDIKTKKPEERPTPSQVLRSQMQAPPIRALEPIIEHSVHPVHSVPVVRPVYIDISGKKGTSSMAPPAAIAADKIAKDVDTYPTAPRYVAEHASKPAKIDSIGTATIAKALTDEEITAKTLLANSKADASVNWRLKTPARAAGSRITSYEPKYAPSSDRSDDAPTMTIDSLFEKFAPSSGSGPVTIKVNTPPRADPAVKEVSQTPFTKLRPDSRSLRASSPDLSLTIPAGAPAADISLTVASEATVDDLIDLVSEPDENTAPVRVTRQSSKSKGTPGAGKFLKRNGRNANREEMEMASVGTPSKGKAPLGLARTVSSSGKGKAPRVA